MNEIEICAASCAGGRAPWVDDCLHAFGSSPSFARAARSFVNLSCSRPGCVVAIPARNEADRIGTCLDAIGAQDAAAGGEIGVLVLVNNASDETAAAARDRAAHLRFPVVVVEGDLPPEHAHAGGARRTAMDLASLWLGDDPARLLLTTDADSRVAPDWLAQTMAEAAAGADAVAGQISFAPEEFAGLPRDLRRRIEQEEQLAEILAALACAIDPISHDPWPRHFRTSGASFAVRNGWYRRVGGLPRVRVGEDRALAIELMEKGAKLRHATTVRALTSARLVGRAAGGTADTIKDRCDRPLTPCDPDLETVARAIVRLRWRRRLRMVWQESGGEAGPWIRRLGVPADEATLLGALPTFSAFWSRIEQRTARLRRRQITPASLPREIMIGRLALASLGLLAGRARRGDIFRGASAEPASQPAASGG